ncbi:MAG TPA: phospholipid carrier-dependent glycosyltransferase [Puia sp.]|nr:phospholipid carrier-dependent glycosyltransferase [Puia sp.]
MAHNGMQDLAHTPSWHQWLNKWFPGLLLLAILVNATGLLLPIMPPDGALYANLAKNMVVSGDYLQIRLDGKDWLDKPHFPFWVTALSYKIFGINGFAYKLPAFLFWLAGAYFTYALARKRQNSDTARLAVLIYLSTEHLIISNNDVRAEPYLNGLIMASVYFYWLADRENKLYQFLLGSLFLAMAVMTKGIFIILLVGSGFVIEWIIRKKWSSFFNYRWWIAALALALFISPELISLYIQFDMHPEKQVFGTTGVSGIRFFFWGSQMGRFLNNGPIRGEGNPFFYLHTFLWAFLPWSFLLIGRLIAAIKTRRSLTYTIPDFICAGIALTGFLLFSFSRFQLPHYLNILYPFFAISLSGWLLGEPGIRFQRVLIPVQRLIFLLFVVAMIALGIFFGFNHLTFTLMLFCLLAIAAWWLFPFRNLQQTVGASFLIVLLVNLFLDLAFYPILFQYDSGRAAAKFIRQEGYPQAAFLCDGPRRDFAYEFYSAEPVRNITTKTLKQSADSLFVFTELLKTDSLQAEGYAIREVQRFPYYPITRLSGDFVNHKTRAASLQYHVLAWVYTPAKPIIGNERSSKLH